MDKLELYELMRSNDAPFGRLLFIRNCLDVVLDGRMDDEGMNILKVSFQEIVDIYAEIRWDRQTDYTGKNILHRAKRTLDIAAPILDAAFKRNQHHDLQGTDSLLAELCICAQDYEGLRSYALYRDAIIDYGGISRSGWFSRKKPRIENIDLSRMIKEGSNTKSV